MHFLGKKLELFGENQPIDRKLISFRRDLKIFISDCDMCDEDEIVRMIGPSSFSIEGPQKSS